MIVILIVILIGILIGIIIVVIIFIYAVGAVVVCEVIGAVEVVVRSIVVV